MATAITLDPTESAIEALRSYFLTVIPSITTVRGPQEFPDPWDRSAPVLSLVAVAPPESTFLMGAFVVQRTTVGGSGDTVLWKVANTTIRIQMDLWTPYRFGGDIVGALVQNALHNSLPWRMGILLTSTTYHDRPLTVTATGTGFAERDADEVAEGVFHKQWDLSAVTDIVVQASDQPVIAEIRIRLTTELGSDSLTEPDRVVS